MSMSGRPMRTGKILGLALEGDSLRVAELKLGRSGAILRKAGLFRFPQGVGPGDPRALGAALRGFLEAGGYSARDAAIGLDARRLMSHAAEVPAADSQAVAGALRIQMERAWSSDLGDLILDYTGRPGAGVPVLVLAARRSVVEGLEAAARRAGLRPRAVTVSVAALAAVAPVAGDGEELMVLPGGGGGDVLLRSAAGIRSIRHVACDVGARDAGPQGDGPPGDGRPDTAPALVEAWWPHLGARLDPGRVVPVSITRWDGAGPSAPADLSGLGISFTPFESPGQALPWASAAAVGLAAMAAGGPPVDFLDSRMAPPRVRGHLRRVLVGTAALALLAWLVAGLVDSRNATLQDIAAMESGLQSQAAELDDARRVVDAVAATRGWYDARPAYLECLRALSLTFPETGGIWTTSLASRDDLHFVASGKAADRGLLLAVMDRLKDSPAFGEVKLLDWRGAERGSDTISFTLGFVFREAGR